METLPQTGLGTVRMYRLVKVSAQDSCWLHGFLIGTRTDSVTRTSFHSALWLCS